MNVVTGNDWCAMSGDQKRVPVRRPRAVSRPRTSPGPLRELKDLLYELYLGAGAPSLDEITGLVSARHELPGAPGRDTIHRILNEAGLPPSQADVVTVAAVLARLARWDEGDAKERVRALWVRAKMDLPIGKPVGELIDPFALEVHRPIEVALLAGAAELPVLPSYVRREHDERLAELVAAAVAGRSGIAMLVGGSSTGKTRACWEALQALPLGWRLWHPLNLGRPEAVAEGLPRVRPRTVVWLNETQIYLNTPADGLGEQVAAGLQELLHDPGRGPVLVLGTIWPDYWEVLCAPAAEGKPDLHAQARMLLAGTGIEVSDSFTDCEMTALRAAAELDPRMAEAVQKAQDRQITQYLAGVPVLLERYRTAPAPAKALIQAAIELRLLGHGPALPQALLAATAATYLSDPQWGQAVDEGWPEKPLSYITGPRLGVPGPLTRIRPRPGHVPFAEPHYRLSDYLYQIAGTLETSPLDKDGFLGAVFVHASGDNVARMTHVAATEADYYTTLYRQEARAADAIAWLRARFGAGPYTDSMYCAVWLARQGRIWEALCWTQRTDELRDEPESLRDYVGILSHMGHLEEVLRWLNDQIDSGHVTAYTAYPELMARTLRDAGRNEEAIIWYRRAIETFDHEAPFMLHAFLLYLLIQEGRKEEAYAVLQPRIDAGDPAALKIAEVHELRGSG